MEKLVRTFKSTDQYGHRIVVTAKLCGEPKSHFSLTSDNGADHGRILANFPELESFAKLHLADINGIPLHAESNSRYFLEKGDIRAASNIFHMATEEELTRLAGELLISKNQVEERVKEIVAELQSKVLHKVMKLRRPFNMHDMTSSRFREHVQDIVKCKSERSRPKELNDFLARLPAHFQNAVNDLAKEYLGINSQAKEIAMTEINPIKNFIDQKRPEFKKLADAAREMLALPDFVSDCYVEPLDDPNTFEGFARKIGLTIESELFKIDEKGGKVYDITLKTDSHSFMTKFTMGSGLKDKPDLNTVLECLQLDASGASQSFEDWCDDLGYNSDSRSNERIYDACRNIMLELQKLFGTDFEYFCENVGPDMPVFRSEDSKSAMNP